MKESHFIPESQVLPHAEMVSTWVKESSSRFNTALRVVAKLETDEVIKQRIQRDKEEGVPDNDFRDYYGHETINGEFMLTGSGFCIDGSIAYGLALQRFPFVKNLHFMDFTHKREMDPETEELFKRFPVKFDSNKPLRISHRVLGFSVDNQGYFLDATYGQIARNENSVIMGPINEIDNNYNLMSLADADHEWTNFEGAIRTDKSIIYPFGNFEEVDRPGSIPPMGIRPWQYLLSVLDDQSKLQEPRQQAWIHKNKDKLIINPVHVSANG